MDQVSFEFATPSPATPPVVEPTPAADIPNPPSATEDIDRVTFGEWLLQQQDRTGWIGNLAKAAKSDRDFPKRGSPDDVRKRLQQQGADGDAFEAVDDAELDWASL